MERVYGLRGFWLYRVRQSGPGDRGGTANPCLKNVRLECFMVYYNIIYNVYCLSWENNAKGRAYPLLGSHFYTTAELCDQSLGDSQSQADSIGPLRQLDKTIENPFQLVVRDSLACIRHIKADFLLRHVIPEANITFFRVLDSIRQ